jgi:hypothetical protein
MTLPNNLLVRMHWKGSPYQLAVLRIAIGLQIFYAVNSRIFDLIMQFGTHQEVSTIFPVWFDLFIATQLAQWLIPICMVLSVSVVLGLFTRIVVPLLTLAFLILFSFYYRGANAPLNWLYFWFPLVVLCFAPGNAVWSFDSFFARKRGIQKVEEEQGHWPVELMVLWYCYIYLAAGLAKVLPLIKGMAWLNGQTSKEIIYFRYLDSPFHYLFGQPFFNYAEFSGPFIALTIGAVLLELFTVVLLFTNRYNVLVLLLITSMHFFLYMTGVAGFMQTALILGLALLKPDLFDRLGRVFQTGKPSAGASTQ